MLRLAALALVLAACTNGYHCGPGDDGCTCHVDGECDLDLRCINGRCFEVPQVKRVFVTSTTFSGGLGGVAAADRACNELAKTSKLGGTFVAWLSSSEKSAYDHVADASPWYLTDHRTVAFPTRAQLRVGPLSVITKDERTDDLAVAGSLVWTGTTDQGGASGSACDDWLGTHGTATTGSLAAPGTWTDASATSACTDLDHLYCFEQ